MQPGWAAVRSVLVFLCVYPGNARQEANDRGRTTAPERHSQSQPDLCGNYDQSMRGRRENWPGIQILEAGPFFIIS